MTGEPACPAAHPVPQVYARIKPGPSGPAAETAAPTQEDLLLATSATSVTLRPRSAGEPAVGFAFNRVFSGSDQQEFYAATVAPLVEDLVLLRNAASVFMSYGATCTGAPTRRTCGLRLSARRACLPARRMCSSRLLSRNCSIFIGVLAAASGKTYTLVGRKECPGVLPRAVRGVFEVSSATADEQPHC